MKPPKAIESSSPSMIEWWQNQGVVYFIAAGEPPMAIKIGMAAIKENQSLRDAIIRRLSQIQSSNHELIRLLGVIHFTQGEYPTRDAEVKERELHNEFKHLCRFKAYMRGAEWFSTSPELLNLIEKIAIKPETLNLPYHFSAINV